MLRQYNNIFLCTIIIIYVSNVKTSVLKDAHITKTNNTSSNIAIEGGTIKLTNTTHESTITNPLISNTSTEASVNQSLKVVTHDSDPKHDDKKINGSTEKIIPVKEEQPTTKTSVYVKPTSSTPTPIEYTGDSKIKPRKGAPTDGPEISTTTPTTKKPTTKTHKMKPTVTTGDDEPYPPSNFVPISQKKQDNDTNKHEYVKYFKKGPDYVLPIVLTILAVPLVAILMTVLYKRGSEWWQHRHYRRMDFLIDGMYNN